MPVCADFLDDISSQICDMIWDGKTTNETEEGVNGSIYIADIQAVNACNHIVTGCFWWEENEFSFEAESGNNNGWVWRSIEKDKPIPEITIERTIWALQPNDEILNKAILRGSERELLASWDSILRHERFKAMPAKYAYDRYVQPGSKIEIYWKQRASEGGLELVPHDVADETRRKLQSDTDKETE